MGQEHMIDDQEQRDKILTKQKTTDSNAVL